MAERMIESVFIEVLNMSLTASVMVPVIFLLGLLLKKSPRIYTYVLWGTVLFRLLCPISFDSNLSLLGVLQSKPAVEGHMEYIPQDIGYQMQPQVNFPIEAANEAVNRSLPMGNPQGSVNPVQIVLYLAVRIWLLGMAVMFIYSALSFFKLRKRLKFAVWERDNIYRMTGNDSPFVYGIVRPRIYLPENLSEKEFQYILLHEQIHIKRRDHIFRMLAYLALCIHWFNPFVWAAFSFSGRDMEISCDEAVLRKLGNGVKREYSASLLNLASGSKVVKGIPTAFGESDTGARIKHVLKYKNPAKVLAAAAAIVCGILAVALMANPSEKDSDHPVYEETGNNESEEKKPQEKKPEQLNPENPEDGIYSVSVRSISRSARCIDRYVTDVTSDSSEEQKGLAFDNNCEFFINEEMDGVRYQEVSFDEFADCAMWNERGGYASCNLTFQNGLITKAEMLNPLGKYGISYEPHESDSWYDYITEMIEEEEGVDALDTYFTLVNTISSDISEFEEGEETVEVYTGNIGDGDSGIVLFKNAKGELLYSEYAHCSRAGWNNIYLGEDEGIPFIMTVYIEDRDTYGGYGYQVFRIGSNGAVSQIAGTLFEWGGSGTTYDDALFKEWVNGMEYYLERSYLILSSQEGELRTEQICEVDKYNYETLKRE